MSATSLSGCKLTYFPLPGRGETARLLLTIGGVNFSDERVPGAQWGALKPNTPWGSMPVLTLSDGKVLAQQRAIVRFIAKHVGLYPGEDHFAAGLIDSIIDACEDVQGINSVGRGKEQSEKERDRLAAVSEGGNIYKLLAKIDAFIAEHGDGNGHCVGDKLTVADIHVFSYTSNLGSGFFDGVPATVTNPFKNIQRVRKAVADLPAVQAWYTNNSSRSDFAKQIEANFVAARNIDTSAL